MVERETWHKYFMRIAFAVASRSTCLRRAIGAVAVKDHRILATGYNGAPSNVKHCSEAGCSKGDALSGTSDRLCRAAHAEMNCIAQAARYGIALEGATIYLTNKPCLSCLKTMINAGIACIIYKEDYPVEDKIYAKVVTESGIKLWRMDI